MGNSANLFQHNSHTCEGNSRQLRIEMAEEKQSDSPRTISVKKKRDEALSRAEGPFE